MPLLSSTKHEPRLAPTVPPPGATDVFVIRCTGECVKSYEEYTAKRTQYVLPQWQEKYFNKSGLTYEEALAIERSVEEQIRSQFPKVLEGDVVRQIHHSTLRKDELVSKVHASLKQGSPGADKENGQQDPAAAPSSSSSQAAPVTKKLLAQFLVYAADKVKPGVWICKEQWVKQYGLSAELPQGVQLPAAEPASPGPSAAKAGSAAGDVTPMKTPGRSSSSAVPPQAPARTVEEEEAKLKPGSIKAIAFQVMKARGASQPVTADDVIRISTTDGTCIDWPDKRKRTLVNVLSTDSAFVRLARGQYTLRALAGDLPLAAPLGQAHGAAAAGGAAKRRASQEAVAAAFSGGTIEAKKKPPKEAAAAAQAAAEEQQQPGLVRAEQLLAQAQKAVAARQADADAAAAYVRACQSNLAEAKDAKAAAVKTKGKRDSDASAAVGAAAADDKAAAAASGADLDARFALPEHLREYTGPEDDRKAKSAWRHERSNEEKRLKKEREAYLQQQRLEAAKGARADLASLQQALDRAKKAAEEAAGKLERAKKAEQDATRGVEREKQREMLKDIKERSKADKEKQKLADREERERRRLEALAAKRYPIDDLELLMEELTTATAANGDAAGTSAAAGASKALLLAPEQLDVPGLSDAKHLAPDQATELGQLLYVADTLSQFARQLGVKGCSSAELQAMLQAAAAGAGGAGDADADGQLAREAQRWLAHTYQQLLQVLVGDVVEMDGAARLFTRWSAALECSAAAWPDLARRWVLLQQQEGLASSEAASAAHFLRDHEAACLSPPQHLALLSQLLDDCLDTSLIRDMLSNRIDEAAERVIAVRAELAEGRRKLRELVDAEKESRKRKRAAALALATAAAERQLREKGELPSATGGDTAAAPTANGGAAADGAATAAGAEDQVAKKIRNTTKEILERVAGPGISGVTLAELEAELAADVEEEPAWELPAELREYSGRPGDKKAMSEFRRRQQEGRRRLEQAQARWAAGQAQRAKAKAEAKKREVDAERRLQQERTRAEEALADQQERLEQQLEKFLVRRQPLGSDRYSRLYWWGLAGNKEGVLLQQEVGCAGATLSLLQEAAAAAKQAANEEDADAVEMKDGRLQRQDSRQSGGGAALRRASVAEAGVDKALNAPLDHKGLLLPPGPEGWAVIDDVALLEGLAGGLEQRGVREKELRAALDKMLPSITNVISKAAAASAAAAAAKAAAEASPCNDGGSSSRRDRKKEKAAAVIPRELPSRHARSAAAEQIRKTSSAAASAAAAAASKGTEDAAVAAEQEEEVPTGPLQGWTFSAFKSAVNILQQLSEAAAAAKAAVPGPSSSWAKYRADLDALLHGQLPEEWAEEAAACASAIITAPDAIEDEAAWASAGGGRDAAWIRAVTAAAQAAADAAGAPAGQQQAAAAAAAVAQLRLQLLAFEQQLVSVSGECKYLYDGAEAGDEEDEAGAGSDAEGEVGEHSLEAEAGDAQQQQTTGRGVKRSAAAAAAAATPVGSGGGDEAGAADEVEGDLAAPAGKRRRGAPGAALPPRPAARVPRGRAAAAAEAAEGEGEAGAAAHGHSPGSREGSAAPASGATAAAAAAAADGGSRKRRRLVGSSGAPSRKLQPPPPQQQEEGDEAGAGEEEQQQQPQHKKQQAQRGKAAAAKGRRGSKGAAATTSGDAEDTAEEHGAEAAGKAADLAAAAAAAAAAEDGDGDAMDVDDEQGDGGGRRRHSLPNKQANHSREEGADVHEEVAEEAERCTNLWTPLSGKTVWRSAGERDSWRNSVAAAGTATGLAYYAAALAFHAKQPLQKLVASAAKKVKKAGGKK